MGNCSDDGHVSLGEGKSVANIGKASISATVATIHRSPQSQRGSGEKGLPASTEGHGVHMLIERLLRSKYHLASVRTGHRHSLCQF